MLLIINCFLHYSACKHMESWKRAVRFFASPPVQYSAISTITNICSCKYAELMDKFSVSSFTSVSAKKGSRIYYSFDIKLCHQRKEQAGQNTSGEGFCPSAQMAGSYGKRLTSLQ